MYLPVARSVGDQLMNASNAATLGGGAQTKRRTSGVVSSAYKVGASERRSSRRTTRSPTSSGRPSRHSARRISTRPHITHGYSTLLMDVPHTIVSQSIDIPQTMVSRLVPQTIVSSSTLVLQTTFEAQAGFRPSLPNTTLMPHTMVCDQCQVSFPDVVTGAGTF